MGQSNDCRLTMDGCNSDSFRGTPPPPNTHTHTNNIPNFSPTFPRLFPNFSPETFPTQSPTLFPGLVPKNPIPHLVDAQGVDGAVVQLVHALQAPLAVVDLNHRARHRGDVHMLLIQIRDPVPNLKRQRGEVVELEVLRARWGVGDHLAQLEVTEVNAATSELALTQAVRADGVLAARHQVVLLEVGDATDE